MNQMNIILLLAVCGLYVVAAEDCGEDGFHALEGDCSRFYRCADGVRYDFECADGLKFNTDHLVCVAGSELDCEALPRPTTEPAPTTPGKPSPPTAECPNGDGHFVDEQDCSRFHVCSGGVRYFSNCDNGLYFDTVSKTCSEPAKAKCTN